MHPSNLLKLARLIDQLVARRKRRARRRRTATRTARHLRAPIRLKSQA